MPDNPFVFWFIAGPGWALFLYLCVAQCLSAISYRLGIRMGAQEPAERITEVGVAFWWAVAFSDLVFYTPLLGLGLWGHWTGAGWAPIVLAAALGITVYWPIMSLAAVYRARSAPGWTLPKERQYWVVLPIIAAWGALALVLLLRA
ncbi:MAG: hypothetical protein HKO95_11495 [Rhodobacteraceae bacterium]|nr:hypothetical protein [Paracoccaceae bacterium]